MSTTCKQQPANKRASNYENYHAGIGVLRFGEVPQNVFLKINVYASNITILAAYVEKEQPGIQHALWEACIELEHMLHGFNTHMMR